MLTDFQFLGLIITPLYDFAQRRPVFRAMLGLIGYCCLDMRSTYMYIVYVYKHFRWLKYILLSVPFSSTMLCFPAASMHCFSTQGEQSSTAGKTLTGVKYLIQQHIIRPETFTLSSWTSYIAQNVHTNH